MAADPPRDCELCHQKLDQIERSLRLFRIPLPPRCLRVSEVAEVLSLSPRAVQRLINRGELRALHLECGGRKLYRVQISDLEAFIEGSKAGRGNDSDDGFTFSVPDWRS